MKKMIEILNKLKNWFMQLFRKNNLQLPPATSTEEIIKNDVKKEFKDSLRTIENEEEKELIRKFESGEISFADITDEHLNKINNGYSLEINRNIEKIQKNIAELKS